MWLFVGQHLGLMMSKCDHMMVAHRLKNTSHQAIRTCTSILWTVAQGTVRQHTHTHAAAASVSFPIAVVASQVFLPTVKCLLDSNDSGVPWSRGYSKNKCNKNNLPVNLNILHLQKKYQRPFFFFLPLLGYKFNAVLSQNHMSHEFRLSTAVFFYWPNQLGNVLTKVYWFIFTHHSSHHMLPFKACWLRPEQEYQTYVAISTASHVFPALELYKDIICSFKNVLLSRNK